MHIAIPAQAPVDEDGYLLHADDVVAQLVLASNNLETALVARGLDWTDVTRITVSTPHLAAVEAVIDVLATHLAESGAHPPISIVPAVLPHPAQAVAISASARACPPPSKGTP